jgi:hypothetical protein
MSGIKTKTKEYLENLRGFTLTEKAHLIELISKINEQSGWLIFHASSLQPY